jgi:tetratricopeptide (TPR) repeat protein
MTIRTIALSAAAAAAMSGAAFAQERSPLDPTGWGVVYDVPATRDVTLRADVPYMTGVDGALTLDLYMPPGAKAGERRPAVVFLNAIGDRPGDKTKRWEIYRTWPRLVAAHGLVGISMDADGSHIQESLAGVFRFLAEHGAEYGVDASRLGVYAASANVTGANEYLFGPAASPGVRAAVLYYGAAPTAALRTNLPVMFVVAESDLGWVGPQLGPLWQRVVEAKAPWTLAFASGLPHAFDAFADNDDARRLIAQTIAFWKSHLEPVPAPPWAPSEARTIVAATYWNDPARAVDPLAKWTAAHPNDGAAFTLYGRALVQLGRTDEAEAAFGRALALAPDDPRVLAGLGQLRFAKRQWTEAADLLGRATAAGMQNSLIFGQLAMAQLSLGRNEEAIRSYERAFEIGIPPGPTTRGVAYYNLACANARLGRTDRALEMLSRAIDEGFSDRATLEADADLAPLRADPRFAALAARIAPK